MLPLLTPWPKAGRVGLWFLAFLSGLLASMFLTVANTGAESPEERPWLWGLGLTCLAGIPFFIGRARLQVWLSGDRLIRQGPFWRSRFPLSRVRFAMTVGKWQYTAQLDSGAVRTVEIEAPVLVMRTAWWRRIKVPLVQQAGHRISGDNVYVAWLPLPLREALAAAIEEYATDPRKDRVALFLRNVERSPVRPEGSAEPLGL